MKKGFSCFMSAVVALAGAAVFNTEIFAASPSVSVGTQIVRSGETVSVGVDIAGNPGIYSICIYLDYDSSKLSLEDYDIGEMTNLTSIGLEKEPYTPPNYFLFESESTEQGITDDGQILNLTFKAAQNVSGTVPIDIEVDDINTINMDGQAVAFESNDGAITINASSTPSTPVPTTIPGGSYVPPAPPATSTENPIIITEPTVVDLSASQIAAGISSAQALNVVCGGATVSIPTSVVSSWGTKGDAEVSLVYENGIISLNTTSDGQSVGKTNDPLEFKLDVSSFTEEQKKNLSAVTYDSNNNVAGTLGGELSTDGKTFTFYAYNNTAKYGLQQNPNLIKMSLTMDNKSISVNQKQLTNDVAPYIDPEFNRTMVPLRVITENLGGTITWTNDPETKKTNTVTYTLDGKSITIYIDKELPNGLGTSVIKDGRTFVPARYILDQLGANIVWNNSDRSVRIYK
jgi:endo-1,4-beta-xylanase